MAIIFEFEIETHNSDGSLKNRPIYWLGCTSVNGEDKGHAEEIYEQLEAQQAF